MEHPALEAAMPDVSRALRQGDPGAAYAALRRVFPVGIAGRALCALIATESAWEAQVASWAPESSADADRPEYVGSPLTVREEMVLILMAEGAFDYEVADVLGVSEHTAKTHTRHVLAKLGTTNRAHAVAEGFRLGLIE